MFDLGPFEPVDRVVVPKTVDLSTVQEVFNHYVDTVWSGFGARPHLTDKRTKLIHNAVQMYGQTPIKDAITGVTHSPWHMGQNPQGKKYCTLELILRPQNIEKFSELTNNDRTKGGFL